MNTPTRPRIPAIKRGEDRRVKRLFIAANILYSLCLVIFLLFLLGRIFFPGLYP
jgi:hypothetical protein